MTKKNAHHVFIAYLMAGICLYLPCPAFGEPLGRLFLTPEQRLSLDALRRNPPSANSASKQSETASTTPASTAAAPNAYVLNGMVRQTGNGYTIWLNGVPYTRSNLPANVKVPKALSSGVVLVTVPESAKAYPLRPGQTLDAASGRVREPYQPSSLMQETGQAAKMPAP